MLPQHSNSGAQTFGTLYDIKNDWILKFSRISRHEILGYNSTRCHLKSVNFHANWLQKFSKLQNDLIFLISFLQTWRLPIDENKENPAINNKRGKLPVFGSNGGELFNVQAFFHILVVRLQSVRVCSWTKTYGHWIKARKWTFQIVVLLTGMFFTHRRTEGLLKFYCIQIWQLLNYAMMAWGNSIFDI